MSKKKSDTPYKKGDILTTDIIDMGINGEGIGKVEGYTLFIKDAVIGDRVRVSIMKPERNYAYAHLDEVIVPSKDRVTPVCPVARACGGCQLQALSYPAQLKFKQEKVRNALIRIGGFSEDHIDSILKPIMGMDETLPTRYRNKAQFPAGRDKEGRIITGFYAGHSHNIIPVDDCMISAPEYSGIVKAIEGHMRNYDISPYDEAHGTGLVRHILIRKGFKTGEIMVCLILNRGESRDGNYLTSQNELIEKLRETGNVTSVSVNLNRANTNVIMGDVTHTIWGEDVIHDSIEVVGRSITYRISPRSFYQVNPAQTDRLYSKAMEYASLTGNETVWDLYCGTGTISLFLATAAAKVYGVEIIPEAIEDAKHNAEDNGIDNATFLVGKAEDIIIRSSDSGIDNEDNGRIVMNERPDVVVVDPPRKGCDPALIETITESSPERIVYVSCDPATLARDLKIMCEAGYELKEATPCDLFPHTVHCECAVLLQKQES